MINYLASVGAVFAIAAAWAVLLLATVGLCRASNRAGHMMLDAYGGWKTFVRYLRWYRAQPENQTGEQ